MAMTDRDAGPQFTDTLRVSERELERMAERFPAMSLVTVARCLIVAAADVPPNLPPDQRREAIAARAAELLDNHVISTGGTSLPS
jgi:hypothetical protein